MNEKEIREEIEQRKKRARDLKLREIVWSLYSSNFKYIDDRLSKEPELILPEVRESLVRNNEANEFRFNGNLYRLLCREGKVERDRWSDDDSETTPMTFTLQVNGENVFGFEMRRNVFYGPYSPSFSEYFGEITGFIDGSWVGEIANMDGAMQQHRQAIYKSRNAPKQAAQLKRDMKNFGL